MESVDDLLAIQAVLQVALRADHAGAHGAVGNAGAVAGEGGAHRRPGTGGAVDRPRLGGDRAGIDSQTRLHDIGLLIVRLAAMTVEKAVGGDKAEVGLVELAQFRGIGQGIA